MSEIICHNNGRYNFYNTISDGFRFVSSIDIEQLKALIKEEHGSIGLALLPDRLDRAHEQGHSAVACGNLDYFLRGNEAGENGKELSTKECIKRFLT